MLFAVDIVFSLIVVIVRHIAVQVNFDPISCQSGSLISSASEIEEQVAIPQLAHEDGPTGRSDGDRESAGINRLGVEKGQPPGQSILQIDRKRC